MSEKVVLPREVAEAIEYIKTQSNPEGVIETHIRCERYGWTGELSPINGMGAGDLIRAIYAGYTVEQTPEERLREYCRRLEIEKVSPVYRNYRKGVRDGVKETLDTLGITIEGIND